MGDRGTPYGAMQLPRELRGGRLHRFTVFILLLPTTWEAEVT